MALELARVKAHLRVERDFAEDDALIESYMAAARAHVEQHCDCKIADGEPTAPDEIGLTADVEQAILLLVGHWYANREGAVVGTISSAVALGVDRLLMYRKRY